MKLTISLTNIRIIANVDMKNKHLTVADYEALVTTLKQTLIQSLSGKTLSNNKTFYDGMHDLFVSFTDFKSDYYLIKYISRCIHRKTYFNIFHVQLVEEPEITKEDGEMELVTERRRIEVLCTCFAVLKICWIVRMECRMQ